MVEPDTILTAHYVMVDDLFKAALTPEKKPGPKASLTSSEVVTLAIFGQWTRFGSERDFHRYAKYRLPAAIPALPYRGQFNRTQLHPGAVITRPSLPSSCPDGIGVMQAQHCPYQALDSSGVPTRDAKRRAAGWLPGQAEIGWPRSDRGGWYEGFHLLISVNPQGVITGFTFAQASTKDQVLAAPISSGSSPSATGPTPDSRVRACRSWKSMSSTRVSRPKPTTSDGILTTGHLASVHPNETVSIPDPRNFAAGWLGCARLWRRSMTSFIIPSGWAGNAPISWMVSKPVWRPR